MSLIERIRFRSLRTRTPLGPLMPRVVSLVPPAEPPEPPEPPIDYAPPATRVALLARQMSLTPAPAPTMNRLDDLALNLRSMSYGDFTEFCEAIDADPGKLWAWASSRAVRLN